MAKVKIQGHASGTGVLTVTAPNTSTDRTITLPDATDTLIGTATSDALTTRVNATGGRKNMVMNGAMQINQRGTTATGGSAALHYGACDRWRMYQETTAAAYTLSQDSNSPDGFGSSYKVDVTTADSTLDAADRADLIYRFEGNELQHLKKGTASAESVTLSFWVSSPKTGTHIVEFYDLDNVRQISKAYTVNSANTWEYKTITYAGDTTGAYGNDVNASVQISFWLMAGSNLTSGTLNTSWGSVTAANRAVGQVNVMDSTSNNFYLTGVQLELGSVATDFEYRSYAEELALCQRYYQTSGTVTFWNLSRYHTSSGACLNWWRMHTPMRAAPSVSTSGTWSASSGYSGSLGYGGVTTTGFYAQTNASVSASQVVYAADGTINMDAEL
jgi:hypothetical protein